MSVPVQFAGQLFRALGCGALWWPEARTLLVADLHLGRPERMARRGGPLLPPFGDAATLDRLEQALAATAPQRVVSLGDAFDDPLGPEGLLPGDAARLAALAARAEWIWVAGNHEGRTTPGFGAAVPEWQAGGITLRHIAAPGQGPDISGHYHPKARLAGTSRPAFLIGAAHLILPAFGAFAGGLDWTRPPLRPLVAPGLGVLTGPAARAFPLA